MANLVTVVAKGPFAAEVAHLEVHPRVFEAKVACAFGCRSGAPAFRRAADVRRAQRRRLEMEHRLRELVAHPLGRAGLAVSVAAAAAVVVEAVVGGRRYWVGSNEHAWRWWGRRRRRVEKEVSKRVSGERRVGVDGKEGERIRRGRGEEAFVQNVRCHPSLDLYRSCRYLCRILGGQYRRPGV